MTYTAKNSVRQVKPQSLGQPLDEGLTPEMRKNQSQQRNSQKT
jgi:hypothetical protein